MAIPQEVERESPPAPATHFWGCAPKDWQLRPEEALRRPCSHPPCSQSLRRQGGQGPSAEKWTVSWGLSSLSEEAPTPLGWTRGRYAGDTSPSQKGKADSRSLEEPDSETEGRTVGARGWGGGGVMGSCPLRLQSFSLERWKKSWRRTGACPDATDLCT